MTDTPVIQHLGFTSPSDPDGKNIAPCGDTGDHGPVWDTSNKEITTVLVCTKCLLLHMQSSIRITDMAEAMFSSTNSLMSTFLQMGDLYNEWLESNLPKTDNVTPLHKD